MHRPSLLRSWLAGTMIVGLTSTSLHAQVAGEKIKNSEYLLGKGSAYAGFTFNVGTNDITDKDGLIVFVNEQKKTNFAFSLDGGYLIRKHLALGALIEYGNNQLNGIITDPNSGLPTQIREEKTNFGAFGTFKAFIPIDEKQRFSIYNQVMLGGQNKSKLVETTTDGVFSRKFVENNSLELRLVPGLQVHVIKGFCVEAGTEIAAFRKSWNRTTENGAPTTKGDSFTADLTINLLRLRLGFYYYFLTKHTQ